MQWRTAIGGTLVMALVGWRSRHRRFRLPPSSRSTTTCCANTPACISGGRTRSCISRCGENSRNTSSARSMSLESFGLYPTDRDAFFTGPGIAVPGPVESRVEFQRDGSGKIATLTWTRDGAPAYRAACRDREKRRRPVRERRRSARWYADRADHRRQASGIILVHGSGPQNRESILPFARFLIRHGMAVFGYDKRGVGGSTGDWNPPRSTIWPATSSPPSTT